MAESGRNESKATEDDAIPLDVGRRRFLIRSTGTLCIAGVATGAVPFIQSCQPTEGARLASLPARIDLTKLSEGEGLKLLWRGLPMWVVRRTQPSIQQLPSLQDRLKDPDSLDSEQPAYAKNELRSRRADIVVLTAVCTHLSCVPELKAKGSDEIDAGLESGFFCPCHGSRFDTAGRVLKGSPASTNLAVPAYYFENETTLVIGADAADG